MQLDCAARDGEAQADAAAGAVAVVFHAIEGVEQARQRLLGNAGAAIAHVHQGACRYSWRQETSTGASRGA